jgi:hypothetical protein
VNRGFSIGIGDVTPGSDLVQEKKNLVHAGLVCCNVFYMMVNLYICASVFVALYHSCQVFRF